MGTFYNTKLPSLDNLVFYVDFGNPKVYNNSHKEMIHGMPITENTVQFDSTFGGGSVINNTGSGTLKYTSSAFSTYDYTAGWSAVAICTVIGLAGESNLSYHGLFGNGNSWSGGYSRFVNLWLQKNSSQLRLHQSTSNSAGNGYAGSFSSNFDPPADGGRIMVGYSHNAVNNCRYFLNGSFLSSASVGSMITSWPSQNELNISSGYGSGGHYFLNGRIFLVLIYNKLLTDAEHLSIYNAYKNRFVI